MRRLAIKPGGDGLQPHEAVPFVLSAASAHGLRVTATNEAAEKTGLYAGMPLSDARAMYPSLTVEAADPKGDSAALRQLTLWLQHYSPYTRDDAADGIDVDITGCAHLFGGETVMLKEIARRLQDFGLTAKLAIGPTIGAAWAAARYAPCARVIMTRETLHDHLAPLPVAGLRLEPSLVAVLSKLGLKQIRDLLGKPRAPLAARFGPELVSRLDQAFGRENESFSPLSTPPVYRVDGRFVEPIITTSAIEYAIARLAENLGAKLISAGMGARKLVLSLYRVDGWVETLEVQTSALALSRDAGHLAQLLCERLDKIKDHTGFGFESAVLSAFNVEIYIPHQSILKNEKTRRENPDDLPRLLDRLVNRFGAKNVTRYTPNESYLPERAVQLRSALHAARRHDWKHHTHTLQSGDHIGRPVLMFSAPEPVATIAEVPDGPPIRFKWRRVSHRVTRVDGPERIAPEWWRQSDGESRQTRDYYRVEDETGRRFWLYRDGLHDREGDTPGWFIHGVFA